VAGLPAKYRDPETGTPYASLEAYAQIAGAADRTHAARRLHSKRRFDSDSASGVHILRFLICVLLQGFLQLLNMKLRWPDCLVTSAALTVYRR